MSRRSRHLQYYGAYVPWGQRPQSIPGGAPIYRSIVSSKWTWEASPNLLSVGAPVSISRTLTASIWLWRAAPNPLSALSPNAITRDLTHSEWIWLASPNPLNAGIPEDIYRDLTDSKWQWLASPNLLDAPEFDCCGREYTSIPQCNEYETICCED